MSSELIMGLIKFGIPIALVLGLLAFANAVLQAKIDASKATSNHSADKQNDTAISDLLPYHPKPSLLTETEQRFLPALESAAATLGSGNAQRIMVQVPLGSLVDVPKSHPKHQTYRNKIDRKTIDFVITDLNCKPIIAIELDDKSHNKPRVRERDAFVEAVLDQVNLPLVRQPVTTPYDVAALRANIENALA